LNFFSLILMGHFILPAGVNRVGPCCQHDPITLGHADNRVGPCCQHDPITLGHAVSMTQQLDPKANLKALGLAA